MNSPLTKHWFPLFMLFTFIAITALSLFIWYDLQRMSKGEQLDAEYTEQLQEELTKQDKKYTTFVRPI
jgi:hypothetical protein